MKKFKLLLIAICFISLTESCRATYGKICPAYAPVYYGRHHGRHINTDNL